LAVAESKEVELAADELYALPPGEFTRARDARVKELRKQGDREAANAVKTLRKPTVAAWALNQLARERSKEVDRLLAAGEELRGAQEELLAGGDRSAFQEAAARERELVAKLSADAAALASESGERAGGLQEKVAETLHAAALDDEIAAELRAGRLVREREAIGGFGAADSAPAPSSTKRPARARAKKPPPRSKSKASSTREEASNRQRLAAAQTDERHARRELDAAARAVKHAGERAEAAEAHAAEAAERARTTAERLKEAKRAETAARKAHTRAARALEAAERGPAKKT
jgi:hypothetical protein